MLVKLQGVQRIVFLGDSITYAGHYLAYIEAYCVTRFPERRLEFINLGLPSETVSGLSEPGHAGGRFPRPVLSERLGRVLGKDRPDLVFLCYGMNDGIYQPFSPARFKAFQDGLQAAHEEIASTGAKIIHITPPVFDPVANRAKSSSESNKQSGHPFEGYNTVLDRYSEWIVGQRSAGWEVVDLHSAMNQWLGEQRRSNPDFKFSRDGVHPDANGHWIIARAILRHLGADDVADEQSVDAMVSADPHGGDILKLVWKRQQLLRDAWLAYTRYKRPGLKAGLPLSEAQARAAELDKRIHELAKPVSEPAPFPGRKSSWEGFDRSSAIPTRTSVQWPQSPLWGNLRWVRSL